MRNEKIYIDQLELRRREKRAAIKEILWLVVFFGMLLWIFYMTFPSVVYFGANALEYFFPHNNGVTYE